MYRSAATKKAHDDSIWTVEWSNADQIITGSVDQTCKVWDPKDLSEPVHTFGKHDLAIISAVAKPDGSAVVTSSMDGYIRVYDLAQNKKSVEINAGPTAAWTLAYHPTADIVATGSRDGEVNLFNVEEGKQTVSLKTEGSFVMSVAFSPDGKLIACGSYDGGIHVFDVESKKLKHKISAHNKPVRALCFNNSSKTLLAGSDDSFISAHEMRNGQQTGTLSGHKSFVLGLAFKPSSSTTFASSSADNTVRIWDLSLNECVHCFDTHKDQVWGVAWNKQGNKLASVADDATLQIFDCTDK